MEPSVNRPAPYPSVMDLQTGAFGNLPSHPWSGRAHRDAPGGKRTEMPDSLSRPGAPTKVRLFEVVRLA
jgi:hypothetical protein